MLNPGKLEIGRHGDRDDSHPPDEVREAGGCAAKHPPGFLLPLLGQLPRITDPRVLVGSSTADDAAIIQISEEQALVFTTDFFTPIVDDPRFRPRGRRQCGCPTFTQWAARRFRH